MMDFSSSPLLPALLEIPSSPPLQALCEVSRPARPRQKRRFSSHDTLSSDPLFSDESSEVGTDNVDTRHKRKRMVQGPWWTLTQSRRRSSEAKIARKGGRNTDSGVWLNSDSSTGDEDAESSTDIPNQDDRSKAATTAAQIIQECVNNGCETVVLSDLGLEQLDGSCVKMLHQLIRHPHEDLTRPPSEDQFTLLTPSIQLYLARNALKSLPAELFRLENLTVLSLRGNALTEIPPAIGRLTRLKELNLAGNALRFLPSELMPLFGGDRIITVRPNPFEEPISHDSLTQTLDKFQDGVGTADTSSSDMEKVSHFRERCVHAGLSKDRIDLEMRLIQAKIVAARLDSIQSSCNVDKILHLGRSLVRFYGVDGMPVLEPWRTVESSDQSGWHVNLEVDHMSSGVTDGSDEPARLPSLFEFALQGVQREYHLGTLDKQAGDYPVNIANALGETAIGAEYGNSICAICARQFIVARAEWVDFVFVGSLKSALSRDTILPFKRKVCSWRCAGDADAKV